MSIGILSTLMLLAAVDRAYNFANINNELAQKLNELVNPISARFKFTSSGPVSVVDAAIAAVGTTELRKYVNQSRMNVGIGRGRRRINLF